MVKKRILSLLLVLLTMMLLVTPVFAEVEKDDVNWEVTFDKSSKAVVVSVNGIQKSFTNFKNNQAEEYVVNGWIVSVTVKGNAIDKAALVGSVTPAVEPEQENTTASNSQIILDSETRIWVDGFGFHCNLCGGNGATDVINLRNGKTVKKGDQKNVFGTKDFPIKLERVGNTTLWNLITDEIECASCGSKEWVTYSNKNGVISGKNIQAHHRSYVEIKKNWVGDVPEGIKAIFDIYRYDSKNKVDGLGELVVEAAEPGVKYQLEPGTYIISERPKEGYLVQPDQRITVAEGEVTIVEFTNVPDKETRFYGGISFTKMIEGENIVVWLGEKKGIDDPNKIVEILSGLQFYLTGTGNGGAPYGPVSPDTNGEVLFGNIEPGTYTLSEEVSGAAVGMFKKMADIENIIISEDHGSYLVLGGTVSGVVNGPEADVVEGDYFTIVNGYSNLYREAGGLQYMTGHLNNYGDLFYIGAINTRTGYEFASFCANAGSERFDEGIDAYMVAHSINERKWLEAFNYIVDNYGGKEEFIFKGKPTSTRTIAQVVVWGLLGAIDLEDEGWGNVNLTEYEKAAVEDTMANYEGYIGSGSVIDVVFLTSRYETGDESTYRECQPQIMPIFGAFYVENMLEDDELVNVSFLKQKYGGILPVYANEFSFELFKKDDDGSYTVSVPCSCGADDCDGLYYTDAGGMVNLNNLTPGDYLVKENRSIVSGTGDAIDNYGYKHVWTIGELCFTIDDKGDVAWYDKDGIETVAVINNEIICKGALQYLSKEHIIAVYLNGDESLFEAQLNWIVYDSHTFVDYAYDRKGNIIGVYTTYGCDAAGVYRGEITPATCTSDAILNVHCDCHESHGARIAIPNTALGHKYIEIDHNEADCVNNGYTRFWCENCGDAYSRFDAPATGHDMQLKVGEPDYYLFCTKCGYLEDNPDYCWECDSLDCTCDSE